MTAPDRPAGASAAVLTGPNPPLTFLMILTALTGVMLAMICTDATIGALVWALLEIAGVDQVTIAWTEGVLILLSLVPAAWLFRQALASEREMALWVAGEAGG